MSRIRLSIFSAFFLVLLASLRSTEAAIIYASGVSFGQVMAPEINEASGLVASRQNPGVLWTHNDTGYPGSVFALSTNGALLARHYLPNVFYGNFEDIAIGPGSSPERQNVYLGDIGDNTSSRASVRVFRFPEPSVYGYQSANPMVAAVPDFQEMILTYPDGSHDAEALMVDPLTGDMFIVTKEDPDARLYQATRAQMDSGLPITLTFLRKMSFSGFRSVSAADISFDGRMIAMRRNGRAWVWTRSATQSVNDALSVAGTEAKVAAEPNGEAIGFHATGLGYFTISENSPADGIYSTTNYYFRRTDSGVPRQPTVFINPGDVWRFRDDGSDQGTAWRQSGFNDSNWTTGSGQFGYGEGDEQTVVSFGLDDFEKHVTTYFRKQFTRPATVPYTNLALRVCFSDGVAVYLNGTEVLRRNLASGATYREAATAANAERQNYWLSIPLSPALVVSGQNTVAVEVHRFQPSDPTLTFDLQLGEAAVDVPARFTGPPALIDGQFRISIAGPAGSVVHVEASGDFQQWSEAGQVTMVGGTGQFLEPVGNEPRFFRLRQ